MNENIKFVLSFSELDHNKHLGTKSIVTFENFSFFFLIPPVSQCWKTEKLYNVISFVNDVIC